jgi:surfactin synthase thioesterase subunit
MLKIKTSRTITRYTAETKHQPEMRLFCFHNAGGSASFFTSWATALPTEIEVCAVQLPGREDRRGEAPLERIEEVLDLLVQELRMYPGGHCFLRTARTHVLAVIQDALGAPEALRRAS